MKICRVILPALACAVFIPGSAAHARVASGISAHDQFVRAHPCPAGGARPQPQPGPCKGWVIDHLVPLSCGGGDTADNMLWATRAEARRKASLARKECRKGAPKSAADGLRG